MLNFLQGTSVSDIALFLLSTFVAILISYVFYLLGLQKFDLRCYSSANRIIGTNGNQMPSDVTIMYAKNAIPRLTRIVYAVWNSGNKVINSDDVATRDNLRFDAGNDGKILSFKLIKVTTNINNVTLSNDVENLNVVKINFDHLAKGDGFVVEILHTAERKYLPILGTIKGLREIKYTNGRIHKGPKQINNSYNKFLGKIFSASSGVRLKYMSYIIIIMGVTLLLFGIIGKFYLKFVPESVISIGKNLGSSDEPMGAYGRIVFGAVYTAMGLWAAWSTRRAYPKNLQCEELE